MINEVSIEKEIKKYLEVSRWDWNNNLQMSENIRNILRRNKEYHVNVSPKITPMGDLYLDIHYYHNEKGDIYLFTNITEIISNIKRKERNQKIDDILELS